MQIFTASIGAAGIRTSGEVADGVIPVWMSPERMDLILPYVKEGIAKARRQEASRGLRRRALRHRASSATTSSAAACR